MCSTRGCGSAEWLLWLPAYSVAISMASASAMASMLLRCRMPSSKLMRLYVQSLTLRSRASMPSQKQMRFMRPVPLKLVVG